MKIKLSLEEARVLAADIVDKLAPACERIAVAGSIRREKPQVGDIEIVCIPKYLVEVDFFGEQQRSMSVLDSVLNAAIKTFGWKLRKGGPLYKQINIEYIDLDLYITTVEKWGVIYTLRTGPAEFSHRLVTSRQYGGFLPSYLKIKDGRVWHGDEPLETPEEEDVFRALGMKWMEPKDRVI